MKNTSKNVSSPPFSVRSSEALALLNGPGCAGHTPETTSLRVLSLLGTQLLVYELCRYLHGGPQLLMLIVKHPDGYQWHDATAKKLAAMTRG